MSNLSEEQRDVLARIDAILTMAEKMPTNEFNFTAIANPFDFLMGIISKKVSFDEMMDWLVNFLTVVIPKIEPVVKGVILAKLKERIDCNNDPRIPYWMRKDIWNLNPNNDEGIIFELYDIDYKGMLNISPLSSLGYNYYSGTRILFRINDERLKDNIYYTYRDAVLECIDYNIDVSNIIDESEISNVYELARAKDFNAFLWFVIHKGSFTNEVEVPNDFNPLKHYNKETGELFFVPPYNPGDYMKLDDDITVKSICIRSVGENVDSKVTDDDKLKSNISDNLTINNLSKKKYNYTIVPISSDFDSVNWYVNRDEYFNFLKKEEDIEPRDYTKEFAICNLKYLNRVTLKDYNGYDFVTNNAIKFTILPKPFVHVPREGEPAWRFKRILFDADGNPDKKGKYSIFNPLNKFESNDNSYVYNVYKKNGDKSSVRLIVDKKSGEYHLSEINDELYSIIYECYPGLTVYEFNYDFLMSIKLFDAVTITSQLLNLISDIRFGGVAANLHISKTETSYQMRISEIVKNIVESTAYEVSDCFYTFDNDKYASMMHDAEVKRSQMYPFNKNSENELSSSSDSDKAIDILGSFNEKATLNERKDTIKRAITKATASITDEVLPEDKYNVKVNIITDIIRSLTNILVESIITPKVILLFEVNKELLGDRSKTLSIEDFIKSIEDVIVGIVREIRDLILKEMLDWAMSILQELFNILRDELIKEQLEYYSKLMRLLLKACSFKAKHRKPLDSELDKVDYADIDEIEKPLETKC